MRRFWLVAFLLPLLVACGGGGSSSLPQQKAVIPLGSEAALGVLTEAQSDARQVPLPLYTPGTNDLLYVSNAGNNSITVYHHNDSLNAPPIRVIAGSKTKLNGPGQLSVDASGNLYVANNGGPSILVFAHGASGNVAPIRDLEGPNTGFGDIEGLTVDQATGKIYVEFLLDDGPVPDIERFPPNATGNQAPFAVTNFGCIMSQIAQDSSGKNLIVTWNGCFGDSFSGVGWVGKQFPTAITPPYGISFFSTRGVADDPTTKTYLVTHTGYLRSSELFPGIVRFAEDTTGEGPDNDPGYPLDSFKPKIVSDITSSSAQTCGQLALGYLRNIYAVCGNQINVYTHDSSGNVPPLRVLKGPATKLNQPFGIYEGQ